MKAFIARRALFAALLVFLVASSALVLGRLAPGDFATALDPTRSPAEIARARAEYGLDRPLLEQYADWLGRFVTLDLGRSFLYQRPVRDLVAERAVNTALLASVALAFATLVGLPLGVVTGSRRGGAIPALVRGASIVCLSLPPLLTSLLLLFLAARTGWFPVGGMRSADAAYLPWGRWLLDVARHLVVPALALGLPLAATLERLQAQAMADTLGERFVVAALARGASARRVVWRDALRPAALPVAAIYGMMLGALLSGSFAVEIVTAWPGLGRLMFDALRARDLYLVAGAAATGALFLALGSLLSDVALALVDPRVRQTS